MTQAVPRLLAVGARVRIGAAEARIERKSGLDDRPIIRLEGHAGREAAERLRGQLVRIPAEDAPPLEAGEYWAHELEGCAVSDGDREVGIVRRLAILPSCEVLEVERENGEELLVPLVGDAVRSVDVAAKRIEIDLAFLGED